MITPLLFFSRISYIKTYFILLTTCAACLLAVSCGGGSTSTDGGMDGVGNDGGGNGNPREATFTNVQQIFNGNCSGSGCHIGNRESGVRLDSYDNVINSTGSQYGKKVVQSNDADGSPIVDKISSGNPQFGVRMPYGGGALSNDDIALIKQWINDGAEDN